MATPFTKPAFARIEVSIDGLSAFLVLEPSGEGEPPPMPEILTKVEENRITVSLDPEAIRAAMENRVFGKKVLIAKGRPVAPGQNGRLEYLVRVERILKPKELENGRVDHHDLGYFINVEKGQMLVRRIPPVPGQIGWTVTGKKIDPVPVKDVVLPAGENTLVSPDDPNLLLAAINGALGVRRGLLEVLQEKTIRGDVDYSTGDLSSSGSIRISGNVRAGFKVKALGNIEVGGDVEDADLESEGNIIIHGGFSGSGKGRAKAALGVWARHVSNQYLIAGKDIVIGQESVNAHLESGNDVIIEGDGVLAGGSVIVPNRLKARVLGNPSEIPTEIFMGVNPAVLQEADQLKRKDEELSNRVETLKALVFEKVKAHVAGGDGSGDDFDREIENLKVEQRVLREELSVVRKRREIVEETKGRFKESRIEIESQIFRGVVAYCCEASLSIKETRRGGTLVYKDGKLVIS